MAKEDLEIRLAVAEDLPFFAVHLEKTIPLSGQNGVHFSLRENNVKEDADEVAQNLLPHITKTLNETGWKRIWLVVDDNGVYGNLTLHTGSMKADMHRCLLGMMVQPHLQGQGWGKRLIETAVQWARDQEELSWIDLGVLDGNDRAKRIYERFGFEKSGYQKDRFRVDGISLSNTWMTLNVD